MQWSHKPREHESSGMMHSCGAVPAVNFSLVLKNTTMIVNLLSEDQKFGLLQF